MANNVIKLVDKINSGGKWALSIMFAVMSIVVFLQVLFRFVLKTPLPWSEELARYLMIWITFLGAGVITRTRGLIMVEAIVKALPSVLQKIISYILLAITIFFTSIVFYYGVQMLEVTANQSASTLPISMAWAYLAIPVGALLMLINTLVLIIERKSVILWDS